MDAGCVDFAEYRRCLRDLTRVNRLTLTHRPMLTWLARETLGLDAFSLLDVGSGQGDALRLVQRRAEKRGQSVRLVGVDLHPWSTMAARLATPPALPITFVTSDIFRYVPDQPVDFIISAQFTHHLDDEEIVRFIRWMETHARRGWFIGDLRRHILPYRGFPLLARAAGWHRFVRDDGRISIGRGFVTADWQRLLTRAGITTQAASIRQHVPFRLCVSRRCAPP
jgi:SAM-dependent methyltransferase